MTGDGDDELVDERLRELPRSAAPPAELEERVVRALREHGLIRGMSRRRALWLSGAAAACVVAGWLVRGLLAPPVAAPDGGPIFVFWLSQLHARGLPPEADLVHEYGQWASRLERDRRLVRVDRLSRRVAVLRGAGAVPGEEARQEFPSGFFIVRAQSLGGAVELAHGCPHLRYGGTITVQAIDPP